MSVCPERIENILLEILSVGLLNIRMKGSDAQYCIIEANHLHNIPSLIKNFNFERLEYYLDVEVEEYKRDLSGVVVPSIKEFWLELKDINQNS